MTGSLALSMMLAATFHAPLARPHVLKAQEEAANQDSGICLFCNNTLKITEGGIKVHVNTTNNIAVPITVRVPTSNNISAALFQALSNLAGAFASVIHPNAAPALPVQSVEAHAAAPIEPLSSNSSSPVEPSSSRSSSNSSSSDSKTGLHTATLVHSHQPKHVNSQAGILGWDPVGDAINTVNKGFGQAANEIVGGAASGLKQLVPNIRIFSGNELEIAGGLEIFVPTKNNISVPIMVDVPTTNTIKVP